MQKVFDKITCLILGHVYKSSIEFNRETGTIKSFYVCERCGNKSISLYG